MITAKKRLGQHFLIDQSVISDIMAVAEIRDAKILEIGPGTGNLTKELLRGNPEKIIAVEFDKACIPVLNNLKNAYDFHNILEILNSDALKIREEDLFFLNNHNKIKVVSNLPYNIGTALILKWLKKLHLFSDLTLMVQKEVADRLIASPKTSSYGSLSIIVQHLVETIRVFDIDPEAFSPPPKVQSSVIRLIPRPEPIMNCNFENLDKLLRHAFLHRRKMLHKNIESIWGERTKLILEQNNISINARAEEVSVDQFCKLANLMAK
jgi:16S rRNA (adenine1518-N6/adenine1519-N6)-dimethyltransferase